MENNNINKFKFQEKIVSNSKSLLENEAYLLCHIKAFGIPEMKTFGYNSTYNILIMELLGPSLENLFQKLNQKFSIKTSCMLGIQMIDRIEYVHSKKIIHRDIKPDNFLIGRGNKSHIVYVLDFGLSKKYWSSKKNKHIPYCTNKKLTGTARYASINALSGCEQGRRDDLESIGYIIIYFIRGNLPWQGLRLKSNEDRYQKILEKKKEISTEELCAEYPKVFYEFVKYSKGLKYSEEPKYDELKKNFVDWVVNQKKEKFDYIFDWTTKEDIKKRKEVFNITCENLDENIAKKRKSKMSKIEEIEGEESNNNEDKENKKKENGENDDKLEDRDKEVENKTDKVESQCCIMYVHIFLIF